MAVRVVTRRRKAEKEEEEGQATCKRYNTYLLPWFLSLIHVLLLAVAGDHQQAAF